MTDLKTIAQLASELNVSRQTIYNRLKDATLSSAIKPYTVQQGKYTLYDVQAQILIKQAVLGNDVKENFAECKRNFEKVSNELTVCKNELDKLSKELNAKDHTILELNANIDLLNAENKTVKDELASCRTKCSEIDKAIDVLNAQLTDKDNQIILLKSQLDSINSDKEYLKSKLDAADINISNLTTALTAAQALHGMDKQQAVIEVKEATENETAAGTAQTSIEPEPSQKKPSLFARLFKRN